MATYNITNQNDLETLPSVAAGYEYRLQNDIALSNWTPIGRTWTGATFDGNGYKLTGMTTRIQTYATETTTAGGMTLGSEVNLGTVHTIHFVLAPYSRSGSWTNNLMNSTADSNFSLNINSSNQLHYMVIVGGGQNGAIWGGMDRTITNHITIIRNGASCVLYRNGALVAPSQAFPAGGATVSCKVNRILRDSSGVYPIAMSIKDIAFTNDAKDSTWAVLQYNGGLGRQMNTTNTPNLTNLWDCDEGTGTSATDSIGGNTLSNMDSWTAGQSIGGFIRTMSSGEIKDLGIDTPVITNTSTAAGNYQGTLVNTCTGTINRCWAKDVTITGGSVTSGTIATSIGGIVGLASSCTISDCWASINAINALGAYANGSAGIAGQSVGTTFNNCYSTDGSSFSTAPDAGITTAWYFNQTTTLTNCFSTLTTIKREILYGSSPSTVITNCYYYDQSQGGDSVKAPVVHFSMDDNAANTTIVNSSPYGYNGTCSVNTDTISVAGKLGNAINFVNGNARYITYPDTGLNNYYNTTVAVWIYVIQSANPDGNYCICERVPHDQKWEFFALKYGDGFALMCRGGGVNPLFQTSQHFAYNTWTHVAVTLNYTTARFYVNGTFNQQGTIANVSPSGGQIRVGLASNGSYGFSGYIDDLRIYNKILSDTDIATLYNSGSGMTGELTEASVPEATTSYFYDVTNAPLTSWDFYTIWSRSQDTVTYPPLATDFSGTISGTVTGYTSGKSMKLVVPDKCYRVRDMQSGTAYGAFASSPVIGNVHTIAWTGWGFTPNTNLIRYSAQGDTGIFVLNGVGTNKVWKYGTNSGSPVSINIAPLQSYIDGAKHRFVVSRGNVSGSTTDIKFWVDGVLIQTTQYHANTLNNLNGILQGSTGGAYSGAYVDELVILTSYVDQTWVDNDWALGKIKRYDNSEPNLLHGYHFDEGIGSVAYDIMGTNNITFQAAPTWERNTESISRTTYSATTGAGGTFSFTSVVGDVGTALEIYISGDTVKGAIVSTLPDGLMGNPTGITLAQDTVQIGDTNLNPAMTYALVNSADLYPITDTCFRTASNILYYRDGCDFLLPTGCTYTGTDIENDTAETGAITISGDNSSITKLRSPTSITLNGDVGTIDIDNPTADITVAGIATLTAATGIADLTNSGTLTFTGVVSGFFDNSGTFGGTISYTGASMTNSDTYSADTTLVDDVDLIGSFDFTPLTLPTPSQTITFENGETYSVTNLISAGTLGSEITLQSDSAGDRFNIDNLSGGELTLNYVKVKDSEVLTDSINAKRSINQGNNDDREAAPHWIFWEHITAFITEHN